MLHHFRLALRVDLRPVHQQFGTAFAGERGSLGGELLAPLRRNVLRQYAEQLLLDGRDDVVDLLDDLFGQILEVLCKHDLEQAG